MNHRVNAKVHNYPVCPECDAEEGKPCVQGSGKMPREPHNIRLKIADGRLILIDPNAVISDRTFGQVVRDLVKTTSALKVGRRG